MAAVGLPSGDQVFDDGIKHIVDELTCRICEEDRPVLVLPCQHRFCKPCIDQLSSNGEGTFLCPTCRRSLKTPRTGFKQCRLSAFVKEKIIAVQQPPQQQSLAIIDREELVSIFQSVISNMKDDADSDEDSDEDSDDDDWLRDMTDASVGTDQAVLVNRATQTEDIRSDSTSELLRLFEGRYVWGRERIFPLPNQLSHVPYNASTQKERPAFNEDMTICGMSYRNEDKLYCFTSSHVNEYIWSNKWWTLKKQFKILTQNTIKSLHKVDSSSSAEHYIIQYQPHCRICTLHHSDSFDRYSICTCHYRTINPYGVYVISYKWKYLTEWECNCIKLATSKDIIYGIDNPSYPRNIVLRYKINGDSLPSISHRNMQEPTFIKAADLMLGQRLLLVSDTSANKVFLFLNEQLCWEWEPQPSYRVGPVAFSLETGYIYAVRRHQDITTPERKRPHRIHMLDSRGQEAKQLRFEGSFTEEIEDIEVRGVDNSISDKLFVKSKKTSFVGHQKGFWTEFKATSCGISSRTSLGRMLQHWTSITGREHLHRYVTDLNKSMLMLMLGIVLISPIVIALPGLTVIVCFLLYIYFYVRYVMYGSGRDELIELILNRIRRL